MLVVSVVGGFVRVVDASRLVMLLGAPWWPAGESGTG